MNFRLPLSAALSLVALGLGDCASAQRADSDIDDFFLATLDTKGEDTSRFRKVARTADRIGQPGYQ